MDFIGYEKYKILNEAVNVLEVTVVKAENVTNGAFSDAFDTPDPYVVLRVRTSPNMKQRTETKSNTKTPVWNETFKFYLSNEKENKLEITMNDDDFLSDDFIGSRTIELNKLPVNQVISRSVRINEKTSLELKLSIKTDMKKELRLSYDLCEEEKEFLHKRNNLILQHMVEVLGDEYGPKTENEVPVVAIMGSGGGYRAACGLSGVFSALQESCILDCATYVAGLSGSSWYLSTLYHKPAWPTSITCNNMADELRERFNKSPLENLKLNFISRLRAKEKRGKITKLVDLFGYFIGESLLDNTGAKLSDQCYRVKDAHAPLPITAAVHVRLDEPAKEFSEWVEFTPYEYGFAKYGVFGKTKDFGGKFYKGQLVKKYKEPQLSYLQGIWGSAFSIILNTLTNKDDKSDHEIQSEMAKHALKEAKECKTEADDSDEDDDEDEKENDSEDGPKSPEDVYESNKWWLLEALNPFNVMSSRRGKAAVVFNALRGLEFKKEQNDTYNKVTGYQKTICLVDAGIAFNSPYPVLLRPERKVEIILSFDFSQRDGGDKEKPFSELLKAEKWAKESGLLFPPIEGNTLLDKPEIQECYVFQDASNSKCPVILHFPIVNKTFREFSKPGVRRVTKEEKDFGNFPIFDDPSQPYSSFKFEYTKEHFDRLHHLMKYNTLANMQTIKDAISARVQFKRNNIKE
ncbi:cytosolic phospholipase A2-like isoform X1 [Xenia sp. Carnegie-2017]|uniref:cytosolic phospholipase A2-like isoform X1 n=1 Tax=Xenia sp. Carnegie-2017 TaxID=2897299 RepID=UPI001F037EB7|nr:cytosolic phospholipase A2-like isoform X1 [Xenia sp. Carnegie-2017]